MVPRTPGRRVAGAVLVALALAAGCRGGTDAYRSQEMLLGTVCVVTVYSRVPDAVIEGMFDVVRGVHALMSSQEPESEISRINRGAGSEPVVVSETTLEVILRGLEYGRISGGAFDISIGPLVKLWGIGTEAARVPTEMEIQAARSLVDWSAVVVDTATRSVYLPRAGMSLDVGGIAKGYAADLAVSYLKEHGVRRALLDFGGNIYTVGTPPGREKWRIGIQNPEASRGESIGVLEVGETSVVSSGAYERYFEQDGVHYHHILDPSTGYPARGVLSTTILSPSSMDDDALSTTLFVLGAERGLAVIRGLSDIEALVITDDKRIYPSTGITSILTLTDTTYTLMPDARLEAAP